MSLTGPSGHHFVTLAFRYEPPQGGERPPPPPLELRQPTPIPSVGDVIELPQAAFRVLARRYRYPSDNRCTVTLVVSDTTDGR